MSLPDMSKTTYAELGVCAYRQPCVRGPIVTIVIRLSPLTREGRTEQLQRKSEARQKLMDLVGTPSSLGSRDLRVSPLKPADQQPRSAPQ